MSDEQEDLDQAGWHQVQQEQRQREEDEAFARHARLLEIYRRRNREFDQYMQEHRL